MRKAVRTNSVKPENNSNNHSKAQFTHKNSHGNTVTLPPSLQLRLWSRTEPTDTAHPSALPACKGPEWELSTWSPLVKESEQSVPSSFPTCSPFTAKVTALRNKTATSRESRLGTAMHRGHSGCVSMGMGVLGARQHHREPPAPEPPPQNPGQHPGRAAGLCSGCSVQAVLSAEQELLEKDPAGSCLRIRQAGL